MKRAIARFAGIFIVASSAFAQTPDFGLPSFHTPLDSSAMNPWDAGFIASRNVATADLSRTVLSTQSRALGQVVLPHGADIEEIRVWGTDSSAMSNLQVQLIASCLPDTAPGAPMLTALATVLSASSGGDFSLFAGLPGTNLADNQSCTYRVEVRPRPPASPPDARRRSSVLKIP